MDQKAVEKLIKETVKQTFASKISTNIKKETKKVIEAVVDKGKALVEAVVSTPKSWILRTEYLSSRAKDAHLELYEKYVNASNRVSAQLDGVNREESNSNSSALRTLKLDETFNKNAVMLHELYFGNISDLTSEIRLDSLPYMRLARDWGTFDNWQFDFRACCMAAREGWAVCYYDPHKNRYMNCVIESHTENVPIAGVPIIVMDMWEHSYYRDYLHDKKAYANAMMKELNWNVIEARMIVVEKSGLCDLFAIQPVQNEEPDKMIDNLSSSEAPIGDEQLNTNKVSMP